MMSLPLAFMVFIISFPNSSSSMHAQPMFIFNSSAVLSPMRQGVAFSHVLNYGFVELVAWHVVWRCWITMPPRAMMATSVVPPPISAIMQPVVPSTGRPAPMAAAIGSSMNIHFSWRPSVSLLLPQHGVSTSVTPVGTPTATR